MTEQELREKIIETLEKGGRNFLKSKETNVSIYEYYADALIAAGLKFDVNYSFTAAFNSVQAERERDLEHKLTAAEHRAEVAERALKKFAENITCEDCPFFSDCASSEKMEDLMHSNYCFTEYSKQAEKELAEDGKDD